MFKRVLLTATVQSHICQFHRPLVQLLHDYGYEVHVAARNNLNEKNGLKLDFADKTFDVPFSRSPLDPKNLKAYHMLKRIIDCGEYEVIHCNTPMGGIVTRLASVHTRRKGTKVFYTAHGFHFYKGAPLQNWLIYYPIEKAFALITDKLITITREDYERAKRRFKTDVYHIHGVGVDEKRYHPAANDDEKRSIRKKLGLPENDILILNIGELLPNKNQSMAIHMMKILLKEYPDSMLIIAGNGPEKENLMKLVKDLKITDKVRFIGYCPYLEEYQRAVDYVVSCSKREGLPLNIVEAMLSGNPVVATNNRGHKELIKNEINGNLVDINDDKMMEIYLKELIKNSKKADLFRKYAKRRAAFYGLHAVTDELKKVYEV